MDQPIVSCVHAVYAVAWPSWCRDEEGEDRSRRQDVAWMRQTGGEALEADAARYWHLFYLRNQDSSPLLRDAASIVEVGCGVGNTLFPLAELNPAARVHGCDFAASAIDVVRRHPSYGGRITAHVADITRERLQPEVAPGSMAVATLFFVLSALSPETMPQALENLKPSLAPGGMVCDFMRRLFEDAGFVTESLSTKPRLVENRKMDLKMDRLFVQGIFVLQVLAAALCNSVNAASLTGARVLEWGSRPGVGAAAMLALRQCRWSIAIAGAPQAMQALRTNVRRNSCRVIVERLRLHTIEAGADLDATVAQLTEAVPARGVDALLLAIAEASDLEVACRLLTADLLAPGAQIWVSAASQYRDEAATMLKGFSDTVAICDTESTEHCLFHGLASNVSL
ncbi:hypothetical protein QBZ16_002504 [Prototheca wickerhamii]|uniref:Methyltransferase type 12 domain-containing protein n=1 Tax=Prototheca wickerhamii TaxID=3111 RepID=A0AAD9IKP9_PROWI|nr:hypothetical protein QBZ16_002504 [Prototheca wickerhamii]